MVEEEVRQKHAMRFSDMYGTPSSAKLVATQQSSSTNSSRALTHEPSASSVRSITDPLTSAPAAPPDTVLTTGALKIASQMTIDVSSAPLSSHHVHAPHTGQSLLEMQSKNVSNYTMYEMNNESSSSKRKHDSHSRSMDLPEEAYGKRQRVDEYDIGNPNIALKEEMTFRLKELDGQQRLKEMEIELDYKKLELESQRKLQIDLKKQELEFQNRHSMMLEKSKLMSQLLGQGISLDQCQEVIEKLFINK
jgi:hypothetical protein